MKTTSPIPTTRITPEEMQRRRKAVEQGDAHNRIEGIYRDPRGDDIIEAYVRGEIEAGDLINLVRARLEPG